MKAIIPAVLLLLAVTSGCKHEVETYTSEPLSDYLPLTEGKYIIYHLDSTVFPNFGRSEEVHSYQEKQEVAAQLTDNLGRPSYRINRYIRDAAGLEPWRIIGNYWLTSLEKTVEVVENNLRTVRLALPLKRDFGWKGNQYLPFDPYGHLFEFRSDTNYEPADWEYYYAQVGETLSLNGQTLTDVITVKHIDEETTSGSDVSLTGRTYSEDKYAKGIGLVYQELAMWELQSDAAGTSNYKVGFGVKRTMLEHN